MQTPRFNLLDSPWIPVDDARLVSLKEVFTDLTITNLAGNALVNLSLFKLLLAIGQRAATPADLDAWSKLDSATFANQCLAYLEPRYDDFYLFGERPFLQMPTAKNAGDMPLSSLLPEVASGNATVLTQFHQGYTPSQAQMAQLVLVQQNCPFGGKKGDHTLVLSEGYTKKPSAQSGSAVGIKGFLHSFAEGDSLLDSLRLNLFSAEEVEAMKVFPQGIGIPPWETMPSGENDAIARALKQSLLGRYVGLCRFVLVDAESERVHMTEGLQHGGYLHEGLWDPSVTVKNDKKPKVIWSDTEKMPWRQLTALLEFLRNAGESGAFRCEQLHSSYKKLKSLAQQPEYFAIRCWGVQVSANAGEQYMSGNDDYIDSHMSIPNIDGETLFNHLQKAMERLEKYAKRVYSCTAQYYKEMGSEGKNEAKRAVAIFWEKAHHHSAELLQILGDDDEALREQFLRKFSHLCCETYDELCPQGTAKQMQNWAKYRPFGIIPKP